MKTAAIILLLFLAKFAASRGSSTQESSWSANDVCQLPAVKGPCKRQVMRWYYDFQTDTCMPFSYGGCGKNKNNFRTYEDCEAKCIVSKVTNENPREQPKDKGRCFAVVNRWFCNKTTHQCQQFMYGECEGNKNNFGTKAECKKRCWADSSLIVDGCNVPKDPGSCTKYLYMWYFSRKRLVCEPFVFGGCGGNANRYITREECERRCVAPLPATAICSLPNAVGSCRRNLTRFYYDIEAKTCRSFTYTGCEGNANNFRTEAECFAKCASVQ